RYPDWFPGSGGIIYGSDRSGTTQLYTSRLDRRTPRQITFDDGVHQSPAVSSDGKAVLWTSEIENANIFSLDLGTGEEIAQTSELGIQLLPEVSPFGDRLSFQSRSAGARSEESVFVTPIGGRSQPLNVASGGFDAQWSADGDTLAFVRPTGDRYELWKVS